MNLSKVLGSKCRPALSSNLSKPVKIMISEQIALTAIFYSASIFLQVKQ